MFNDPPIIRLVSYGNRVVSIKNARGIAVVRARTLQITDLNL